MMITAAPPRRPNRNRRVLIALAVWASLATVLFVWCGVQNAQYRSHLKAATSDVRAVLDAAPQQVKQAKESGDAGAVAAALTTISAAVSQKGADIPFPPSFVGVQIGLDAEVKRHAELQSAAKDAANALKASADSIDFQTKFARSLQALSLKDAGNSEQTIALANSWKEAANTLQHATKPAELTEVSATLLQKMIVAESRIRELAERKRQGDAAGFVAKQKELAAIIEEMKPLGVAIAEISTALDTRLARSLDALRQKL